jgi:hypothetical protein
LEPDKQTDQTRKTETKKMSGKPKASGWDHAHTLARAGLSAIPVVGGVAKEFFNAIIAPPLTKNLIEWMESLENDLHKLEDKFDGFKIEDLKEDKIFATKFSYALQIAIRNHRAEKLVALRNTILNSALSSSTNPEEDLQHMFFNFIDTFTPWHLKILKFFDDPKNWLEQNKINFPLSSLGYSTRQVLEHAFPELRRDFFEQIVKDLSSRGLLKDFELGALRSEHGALSEQTTTMGKKFLKFISSPISD